MVLLVLLHMFELLLQLCQVRVDCCAVRRNAVVQNATEPLDFVHRGLSAEHLTKAFDLVHPVEDGDALLDTGLDTQLLLQLFLHAQQVAHLLLVPNSSHHH